MNIRRKFCYKLFPLKFLPGKSKKRINFNCILFEVNIFIRELEKQYLKKCEKQMRNEFQLMKAKVQSIVVSFVQNERNTLYRIDVIHLLICDKDRILFFLGISFSPKIFCLCLHSPFFQALLIKLEHIFSSFSTRVLLL